MAQEQQATPAEFQGRLAAGKNWMEIVAWVGDLPPLPHVAAKAIQLVEDPDATAQKLTDVLSSDTALAARVLKIANSAMFSRQREITTLSQAIMVIGFKALKGIIVAATLRQLNRSSGKTEKLVWENSMCTAMGAHILTAHLKKRFLDEVFLLGLLHDLGKLVLIKQTPKEYIEVNKQIETGLTFVDAEMKVLGFAHPLIGALVAKKWNFSPEICQVILHHHDPLDAPLSSDLEEKTAIIQLADALALRLGKGRPKQYPDTTPQIEETAKLLNLDMPTCDTLVVEIEKMYADQSSVFE